MLADVYRGFHHLPGKFIQNGRGIHVNARYSSLATFDYNHLTVLVVVAHDRMIRVEIRPSGPGAVKIILHKRHVREGDMSERHPTLESQIASIRKDHGGPLEQTK